MGIPKLNTFISQHYTGWRRKELKGHLVIDGYNIRHHLNRCDWSHGGQFGEYRRRVTNFYKDLMRRGVHPIVVLDGIDHTGKKWSTTMRREKDRIKHIHKEISGEDRKPQVCSQNVLPALAGIVYVQVLIDLGVEYVMVDGEADDTLVEIANYYRCPVLSSDSDFYIYGLVGGYVSMEKLDLSAGPITAQVYHYQDFCAQFRFSNDSVRLIVPALVGNDFWSAMTSSESFEDFLAEEIEVPDGNSQSLLSITLFASLFDSLESFIDEVPSFPYLRGGWKSKLIDNCKKSRDIYTSDRKLQISEIQDVTVLCSSEGEQIVPLWALRNFRNGHFSKFMINALVLNKYVFNTFIDDTTKKESCILTSRPIRKNIYQILGRCSVVTEYFREGTSLSGNEVYTAPNDEDLPSLEDIPRLSHGKRANLLYSILGCDDRVFWGLEPEWRLVLAATVFWYGAAHPPQHLVRSLLLCFAVCCHPAVIKRRLTAGAEFRRSSEWLGCLHCFAQWQSCYKDVISLNQVLNLPLTATCPSQIYNGKLVMFFAMPRNYDEFISSFNDGSGLFRKFLDVVCPKEKQLRSSRSKYVPQQRQQPWHHDRVVRATHTQQPQGRSEGRRYVPICQPNWRDDDGFEPVPQQPRDRMGWQHHTQGRGRGRDGGGTASLHQQPRGGGVQRPLESRSQVKPTTARQLAAPGLEPKSREHTTGQRPEELALLSRHFEKWQPMQAPHCHTASTTMSQPTRGHPPHEGNAAASQRGPARGYGEHGEHRSEYRLSPAAAAGELQQQPQLCDATTSSSSSSRSRDHHHPSPPRSSQRGASREQHHQHPRRARGGWLACTRTLEQPRNCGGQNDLPRSGRGRGRGGGQNRSGRGRGNGQNDLPRTGRGGGQNEPGRGRGGGQNDLSRPGRARGGGQNDLPQSHELTGRGPDSFAAATSSGAGASGGRSEHEHTHARGRGRGRANAT